MGDVTPLSAVAESVMAESHDEAQTKPQKPAGPWSSLRDDINLTGADWPILACSFVSGLVDSVSFNAASVFVSMQTGMQPSISER